MNRKNEKKVLLISNNGMGFYNFKKELVEKLISLRLETHFAVPYYEKLEELVDMGAVYHELTIDRRGINPVKDLGLIYRFNHLIDDVKPDLIVLHTIKPNIYVSLIAKIKKISFINNITGLGSALQHEGILARIIRALYRTMLSESCGIFFENAGNMHYFKKHNIGDPQRYIVVPGAGVNIERFLPGKPDNKQESDIVKFLYIARIMREKGIEEFLDAAENIKKRHDNVSFQILGWYDETEYKDRMNKLTNERIIEYMGVSSDTRNEMLQADCIVLPSYHEGMSNVLLEGAAMGLPLITTDVHGCKEAVEHGKNGFLCKGKDSDSLIAAMERFIALSPEERHRMGLCGRDKMIKEFDRRLVVERYTETILNLIGETS